MLLIRPSFTIWNYDGEAQIAHAARVCYKSEYKIKGLDLTEVGVQQDKILRNLISKGHHSVLEHCGATVKIVCDRGVTHEIVRHRLVSYSQESTRYCDYSGGVTFIIPPWTNIEPCEVSPSYPSFDSLAIVKVKEGTTLSEADMDWTIAMRWAERSYLRLRENGWSPQQARSVLPNSLKTEIVVTTNYREWRHIFQLRTDLTAHPQMREIMIPLLQYFKVNTPILFEDINVKEGK